MEVALLFSSSKSKPKTSGQTYTPGRQRALARRSSMFGLLAVVLVILALAQFGENGLATYLKLRSQEKNLAEDVVRLEKQNQALQNKLQGLASEPQVLEAMAREEFNMKRPDEEVLVVLPEKASR